MCSYRLASIFQIRGSLLTIGNLVRLNPARPNGSGIEHLNIHEAPVAYHYSMNELDHVR